jgi:hypothetical protein
MEWAVGSIIFLRFLVPCITDFASDSTLVERKVSITMARVLMKLVAKSTFSDPSSSSLNLILSETTPSFETFCSEIILIGAKESLYIPPSIAPLPTQILQQLLSYLIENKTHLISQERDAFSKKNSIHLQTQEDNFLNYQHFIQEAITFSMSISDESIMPRSRKSKFPHTMISRRSIPTLERCIHVSESFSPSRSRSENEKSNSLNHILNLSEIEITNFPPGLDLTVLSERTNRGQLPLFPSADRSSMRLNVKSFNPKQNPTEITSNTSISTILHPPIEPDSPPNQSLFSTHNWALNETKSTKVPGTSSVPNREFKIPSNETPNEKYFDSQIRVSRSSSFDSSDLKHKTSD